MIGFGPWKKLIKLKRLAYLGLIYYAINLLVKVFLFVVVLLNSIFDFVPAFFLNPLPAFFLNPLPARFSIFR